MEISLRRPEALKRSWPRLRNISLAPFFPEGKEEFDGYLGKLVYQPNVNISTIMKDIHRHIEVVTAENKAIDQKLKSNK